VAASVDSAHFRDVLGRVPTSVVVVTGTDADGAPRGMTIGSFVSVSLDPPLVGFFIGTGSRSWEAIAPSGRFCVNVLAAGQDETCWRFAKEGDDKFAGLRWSASGLGNPAIDGCAARIDCTIESATPAGDHAFVLGRVHALSGSDDVDSAMVFYRGRVAGITHAG